MVGIVGMDSHAGEQNKKYEINKILLNVDFQSNYELNIWLQSHTALIFQDENFILYQINGK